MGTVSMVARVAGKVLKTAVPPAAALVGEALLDIAVDKLEGKKHRHHKHHGKIG